MTYPPNATMTYPTTTPGPVTPMTYPTTVGSVAGAPAPIGAPAPGKQGDIVIDDIVGMFIAIHLFGMSI